MRFTIFQESRKGARKVNQDRIAYTYSRETLLLVVADGMGGHVGGEIAAQIAVRLFIERFQQEAKPILQQSAQVHAGDAAARACRARLLCEPVLDARNAAHDLRGRASCRATTLTGRTSAIRGFYLLRQGKLIGATKDHSKVQYLVDQGIIAPQDVATHPDRNKIFSCLGGAADPVIDLSQANAAIERRHPRSCAPTGCGACIRSARCRRC